jgi:hypothetical protein
MRHQSFTFLLYCLCLAVETNAGCEDWHTFVTFPNKSPDVSGYCLNVPDQLLANTEYQFTVNAGPLYLLFPQGACMQVAGAKSCNYLSASRTQDKLSSTLDLTCSDWTGGYLKFGCSNDVYSSCPCPTEVFPNVTSFEVHLSHEKV